MARVDNRYSRFVLWAKIIFPLVALGLLSTMFLLSSKLDPDSILPTTDFDVEKVAREQQLTSPRFSGTTSDGSAVVIDAESALPDLINPRRLTIQKVIARIETQNGPSYGIIAKTALYDGNDEILDLEGEVRLSTSTGYRLETEKLTADLATTGVTAPGFVTGRGPAGMLEAGSMKLTTDGATQVLVFKNGVKLVYDPKE